MKARIENFGEFIIPDQTFGNSRLNVYPFEHNGYVQLPEPFKLWEESLNKILENVPIQPGANNHAITICSDFFTNDDFQRREGIHIDGNFCVDPNFTYNGNIIKCWGGISPRPRPTWAGLTIAPSMYKALPNNEHVIMDWVLPYDVIIPVGTYVSETLGGLFIVSTNVGTMAWDGEISDDVREEGCMEHLRDTLTKENGKYVPKNELVFLTSNTPHETLLVPKGTRRTFMRLTLDCNYDNTVIGRNINLTKVA